MNIVAHMIALFLRREAGDGELAAIHTQACYVDSFRRRRVRDVNNLLKVMVVLLLAQQRPEAPSSMQEPRPLLSLASRTLTAHDFLLLRESVRHSGTAKLTPLISH